MSPIAGLHLVRYGTAADQKYLLGEFLATYDQLVLNATIVAHMPGALASFISQRAKRKPYLIDPQTHAFQHGAENLMSESVTTEGRIKRSIKTLLDAYGDPVKRRVLDGDSVLPSDFQDAKTNKEFCRGVLEFQLNTIPHQLNKSDSAKYYKFLRAKGLLDDAASAPSVVVAPYFFMTASTVDRWLDVNVRLARESAAVAKGLSTPVAVQIVLSRDALTNKALRDRIVAEYTKEPPPAVFLIWVDAFSELDASDQELNAFSELIEGLANKSKVVNLYGGFCSVALARGRLKNKLIGVAHGLEYGEDRSVTPVGGGFPIAKFYFPRLYTRLAFRNAIRAVRAVGGFENAAAFREQVCDCRVCRSIIKEHPEADFAKYGGTKPVSFVRRGQRIVLDFPLPETKDRCVKHYMWCKQREYRGEIDIAKLKDNLKADANKFGRALGLDSTIHCEIWSNLI